MTAPGWDCACLGRPAGEAPTRSALAFHTWRDPLDRAAALAQDQNIALATPEIGEVLTLGRPRTNVLWWKTLR